MANKKRGRPSGFISEMKGKKRPPFSAEWRANISKSGKGREVPTKGSNHYNWKGGKTSLILRLRHSFKYRQEIIIFVKYA